MANSWPRYTVAELQAHGLLLVEDGNHGEYRPRTAEFGKGLWSFIRAADMDNGTVRFDSAERINDVAFTRIRKGVGKGGDVLFSHKGTVGKLAVVPLDAPPFVCSPQTTFWRTLDEATLSRHFLYYYMQSRAFTEQWMGRKGETDMADYVSLTAQRELFVSVPPLSEQKEIAETLRSLDDKIEQNRRTGAKLEGLARAVFKAWFVDFEPVKAKAAGATTFPGMPPKTFAALPTRFTDSPLGPVPQGWEVGRLQDVLTLHYGKALNKSQREPGHVPVYGSGGVTGTHNKALVPGPGIIVGRKGSVGTLYWEDQGFFPIDTTFYVEPAGALGLHYLFELLGTLGLENMNTDAAVPGLNRDNAYRLEVVLPSTAHSRCFEQYTKSLRDLISHTAAESAKLAALRDYLLPRLLNGRVRVEDVGLTMSEGNPV